MKTINILKTAVISLFVLGTFTACVDDKDFDTPQVMGVDDFDQTNVVAFETAINKVNNQYQFGVPSSLIYTYPEDSNAVIAAYVVSDDTTGNFYKELVVQNDFENPTAGLEIDIDQGALHAVYNKGRKVYIKMAGLSVGYLDGAQGPSSTNYENRSDPTDGVPGLYKVGITTDGLTIDRIPLTMYPSVIIRSNITANLVAKTITTDDFNDDNMNQYVQIENIQFLASENGKTYANEPGDSFDAERMLVSCDTDVSFGLMTSTFANYSDASLPVNKGTLKGVLTKNFREVNTVIVLSNVDELDFTETDRCDPIMIDCGVATSDNATTIFEDDFSGNLSAWTNYTQEGDVSWETYTDTNSSSQAVRLNPYNNGSASVISWLISPVLDFDANTDEVLSFSTSNSYSDDSRLEVFLSNDWDGTEANILSATWAIISQATVVDDSENYQNWISSGFVDLSCATGNSYIAFRYTGDGGGGSSTINGTYELDNVKVTGN